MNTPLKLNPVRDDRDARTALPCRITYAYTLTQAVVLMSLLTACGSGPPSIPYTPTFGDSGMSGTCPVNGSRIASVALTPNKYRVRGWACVNPGVIGSAGLRIDGLQVASLLPKPCDAPRNWAERYGYLNESASVSAAIPTSDGSAYGGHVEAVALP
jgi:hypothetical protein